MRFPFFNNQKIETKEPIKTVPATPAPATNKLAATQRIPTPVHTHPRFAKPSLPPIGVKPAAAAAPAPVIQGPTVTIKLAPLAAQIPSQVFSVQGQASLPNATVNIPVSLVLPQLATGKISIKLSELLACCPQSLLRSPLPPYPETQGISLPLEEIIPAIPADLLNVQHDSEISANDPELDKLPVLIDEESIAARKRISNRASLADTQPLQRLPEAHRKPEPTPAPVAPPAPKPEPVAVAPVESEIAITAPQLVIPPRQRNDLPEYIMISVKSLVSVLPDNVFNCPRADAPALTKANPQVLLPAEPIITQLRSGSVRMPVSVLVALLPHTILANPMPDLDGLTASLPLAEIIPQLSANIFTDHLREPAQETAAGDLEIPDPFREKNAAPAAPVAPTVDLGVTAEALEDESFNIFAEKSPAAAPQPVAVPEPVAEVVPPPAPVEPVAEVIPTPAPVAPVAEPVVETPAPVAEPAYADVAAEADITDAEAGLPPETTAVESAPVDGERKLLIDLNRCTVEDLMAIPGVGRALAQRIVDFRNVRGHFTTVDELRRVPGIGRKTFRALAGVQPHALNRLLGADHDGELSLQEVVRLTGKLPGIEGCMLALSDGLFLTGQLPPHLDKDTISVFAPQLFKKVGRYSRELKVGQIRRFTIFTDNSPVSIFKAGEVYLIIVHDAQRYSKALLRRCERISEEIARLSSQRVTV